jgi:hypothetical protein
MPLLIKLRGDATGQTAEVLYERVAVDEELKQR